MQYISYVSVVIRVEGEGTLPPLLAGYERKGGKKGNKIEKERENGNKGENICITKLKERAKKYRGNNFLYPQIRFASHPPPPPSSNLNS